LGSNVREAYPQAESHCPAVIPKQPPFNPVQAEEVCKASGMAGGRIQRVFWSSKYSSFHALLADKPNHATPSSFTIRSSTSLTGQKYRQMEFLLHDE